MKLLEFMGPDYTVFKVSDNKFNVMKFNSHKEPAGQYHVEKRGHDFWTDAPEFMQQGQAENHIKIVKQFLADGEPHLTSYYFDSYGKLIGKKF